MGGRNIKIKEEMAFFVEHKWRFLFLFLGVFFVTFSFLSAVGFVPEYIEDPVVSVDSTTAVVEASEHIEEVVSVPSNMSPDPLHITIASVGIDVNVENPQSRDIKILDAALNDGAVHYPGTGSLTEDANIFIFGHSSFLPNVINKNYQAFNGLKKLEGGEEIFVDSLDTRYVYKVTSVELAEAQEIQVDLSRGVRKLTLSTCNSFGAESERYIVEADFVGSYVLTI